MEVTKIGYAISIDINKDYIVRANILHTGELKDNTYEITLELRRKDIGKWDCMGDEVYHLESNKKKINTNTIALINRLNEKNFFKYYIDRYEFELKCFETGFEVEKDV